MGTGAVDHEKLRNGFKEMGMDMSEEQIQDLLRHIDEDESGHVSFEEFLAYSTASAKKKMEKEKKAQRKKEEEREKARLAKILPEYDENASRQEHDFDIFFKSGDIGIKFARSDDGQTIVEQVVQGGQAYMVGIIDKGNILVAD